MTNYESTLWRQEKVLRPGLTASAWCKGTLGVILELSGIDDDGRPFRLRLGSERSQMFEKTSLEAALELIISVSGPLEMLRAS